MPAAGPVATCYCKAWRELQANAHQQQVTLEMWTFSLLSSLATDEPEPELSSSVPLLEVIRVTVSNKPVVLYLSGRVYTCTCASLMNVPQKCT